LAVVVPLDGDLRRGYEALHALQYLVRDELTQVNDVIVARMQSRVELIPTLASHLIASGGKRLRPMLTLASAKLCGYSGGRQLKLAACVEFIHTATLLHDDVVDESDLRRGAATANAVFGNEASVLVGDFLFSRSFQLMVEDGSLRVLEILSNASSVIAEGEVAQLLTNNDTSTSEDAYLEVIRAKTAALFAAACSIGAVVADRPNIEEDALDGYGRNLGIAFQLVDDALDYSAEQVALGKTVGDDFREGKLTLPVVLAYRRGSAEERSFWQKTLEENDRDDEDFVRAVALMNKHGSLDATIERARHYGEIAKDALGIFSDSDTKEALLGIVDFCVSRGH
jgi:octaprenyl-diphosphate synthase